MLTHAMAEEGQPLTGTFADYLLPTAPEVPNIEILFYGGWYLLYRYWPTSHNAHRYEAYTYFCPARTVRERIEHEVAAVVLKEFALQDAGMLGGTQAALEYDIIDEFPLNDQEILVRHLHKATGDWVRAYSDEQRTAGVA